MHDGIHLEKAGVPAVTICTHIFTEISRAMASMWGAADFPLIFTKHPISHLTREQLRTRAEEMLGQMITILTGSDSSEILASKGKPHVYTFSYHGDR